MCVNNVNYTFQENINFCFFKKDYLIDSIKLSFKCVKGAATFSS